MTQNRSAAVMQQRAEVSDSLDDFPTPPWATRALCHQLIGLGHSLHRLDAWEPACNRGHMAQPLSEYFNAVTASDIVDYGWEGQHFAGDFLLDWPDMRMPQADWIVTNPPFRLGADFIRRALALARVGVAVLVRTAFVEGQDRYESLFARHPEAYFMPFVERVTIWRGVLLDPDVKVWRPAPGGGRMAQPSTATSYCWLVWLKPHPGRSVLHRIPPCRRALTGPGDYPDLPRHLCEPRGDLLEGGA